MAELIRAPYNWYRIIREDHSWPFGHCGTCGKTTMYNCNVCGQCATEANTPGLRRRDDTTAAAA